MKPFKSNMKESEDFPKKRDCKNNLKWPYMERWQCRSATVEVETSSRSKKWNSPFKERHSQATFAGKQKYLYLIHIWSDKALKGTVLNRELALLLEITLIVLLRINLLNLNSKSFRFKFSKIEVHKIFSFYPLYPLTQSDLGF